MALQDKDCQRNWTRLESYLEMLREIATSSVTATQYLLDRSDAISDLIDFTLGSKSPRAFNEVDSRVSMGGVVPPPFWPVYTLVSHLVCETYTSQMDLEHRLPTHNLTPFVSEHEGFKSYFLTEEALLMLTKTEFLEKVIFDHKYEDVALFAKAVAHLCYGNLKFSRHAAKKLLKALSWSDSEHVQRHLVIIEQIARVKDEFQPQRLELLFGFAFLLHVRPSQEAIPQYGAWAARASKEQEVFGISSGLDARQHDDALLNLIWKSRGHMESFTLACLECVGRL